MARAYGAVQRPRLRRWLVSAAAFCYNHCRGLRARIRARWPHGSFSVVDADDETHARIQLDELGEEPTELWLMQSCLLDFDLTDEGTFGLGSLESRQGPRFSREAIHF